LLINVDFASSKYSFLAFLAVFELGSLICATANGSTMFIVGRAVAGIGGAGLINGCLNIVNAAAPLSKRPTLVGLTISIASLGSVAGPLIDGEADLEMVYVTKSPL